MLCPRGDGNQKSIGSSRRVLGGAGAFFCSRMSLRQFSGGPATALVVFEGIVCPCLTSLWQQDQGSRVFRPRVSARVAFSAWILSPGAESASGLYPGKGKVSIRRIQSPSSKGAKTASWKGPA